MKFNYKQGDQEVSITLQDGDGVLVYTDYGRRVRWEAVILVSGSCFALRRRGGWNDVNLGVVNSAVVRFAEEELELDLSANVVRVAYLPATN